MQTGTFNRVTNTTLAWPRRVAGAVVAGFVSLSGVAAPAALAQPSYDALVNDLLRERGLPPLSPRMTDPPVASSAYTKSATAAPASTEHDDTAASPPALVPSLARESQAGLPADYETLGSVLQEVWLQNPQVLQAVSNVEAAGHEVAGARIGYYPFLSVDSRQATNNASATTASIIQPLWDGGLTGAKVAEARVQRKLTLVELNQTRLDLGLETAQAYLNTAAAQEQAGFWRRYIEGLHELLEVIKRRADRGLSPKVDVQTALTRLRQAEAGATANRSALLVNRTRLSTLLGREVGDVAWPPAAAALAPAELEQIDDGVIPRAHPARQRARFEVELAQARAEIGQAKLWPKISLQHSQLVQQSAGDFTPEHATQLVLQYQTDETLKGYRGAQAAQERVEAARQGAAFAKREVANRIRAARVQRQAAAVQFAAQAAAAAAALKLVDSFLRQFKVGRKSWIEVLNVYQEAHQTLLQSVVVKNTYWQANAQMALEGMHWNKLVRAAPPVLIDRQ